MEKSSSDKSEDIKSLNEISNGIASKLSSFDTNDDDDDDHVAVPEPSELYGNYTWILNNFSKYNKKTVRSNAFEAGGCKWHFLLLPDVHNHLSLFLCVADHDKLLPGWTHLAQFTMRFVNKDPKKSINSDALHRCSKKEHYWEWKIFMDLSKLVNDGFVDNDTLIIKSQIQVIRDKNDNPFRCLDTKYRKELLRVYSSDVAKICHQRVKETREKLEKMIEDKFRWSSFCDFWLKVDKKSRHQYSRVKSDIIWKNFVKHFFEDKKEVTSALVMDLLYGGLKELKGQSKKNKVKGSCDAEEFPIIPFVKMENDTFVLVDDLLPLVERYVFESLALKDEKCRQSSKQADDESWNDLKDLNENDETRLTELGRKTIESTIVDYICSTIDIACALKRQEDLINEEEIEKAKQKSKSKSKPKPKTKCASKKGSRVLKS